MISFVSIDWGGTSLKGVFYNDEIDEIHHFNLSSVNLKIASDQEILASLESVKKEINYETSGRKATWLIGAAGGSGDAVKQRLSRLFSAEQLYLYPDYLCNFNAAFGKGDGCLSVNGTGSVSFMRKANKTKRFGGWGYLLDKTPSGAFFGKLTLEAVLVFLENGGKSLKNDVCKAILEKFSKPMRLDLGNAIIRDQLLQEIYQKKNIQKFLGEFSSIATDEYNNNNEWFVQRIDKSIELLLKQIIEYNSYFGLKSNHSCSQECISLCGVGGLWEDWKQFKPSIAKQIDEKELLINIVEPLYIKELGPALTYFENDEEHYEELLNMIPKLDIP